jgi:hypothetical protein
VAAATSIATRNLAIVTHHTRKSNSVIVKGYEEH